MALEGKQVIETFIAGADLSAAQFKIVKGDTTANRQVVLQATSGALSVGVLLNKPTSGQAASVMVGGGYGKALAGAAVATLYTELTPDTTGRLIGASSGHHVIGLAVTTATAAGEFIEFVWKNYVKP
jgi:hypothetical protein